MYQKNNFNTFSFILNYIGNKVKGDLIRIILRAPLPGFSPYWEFILNLFLMQQFPFYITLYL